YQFDGQPLRVPVEDIGQRFATNVLHDHPVVALAVGAQVVEGEQVGVFEVEALGHAAQLHIQVVAAHQLEGHFLAAVAEGIVDLAEAPTADAPLERIPIEDTLSGTVGELHNDSPHHLFGHLPLTLIPSPPSAAV